MFLNYEPGDYVINPNNKDWGIGQIQSIINNKVTVNFENVGKKVINGKEITLEKIKIKLNNLNFKKYYRKSFRYIFEAGKIAKKISNKGVKITIKPDKSPVTDGDLEVDKLLRNKIKNLTKDIPIISEETVDFKLKIMNKTFWLIDPIDGTKDYIKKKDEYTLNAC